MTTLFVNRLTVIDFSYLDPTKGLLGESWQVDIELDGSLDHQGMVLDFGDVKKQVKRIIDQEFDHCLLVPAQHPNCQIQQLEHRCDIHFQMDSGELIRHSSPYSAICLINTAQINEAALCSAISEKLQTLLPDNVQSVRIRLYPEPITGAWYRYSHGLKHHAGNCQRIAHGHRSRITIYRNDNRDQTLEADWAKRWEDIYIGTQSDLQEAFQENGNACLRFGYTANQGLFKLEIPTRCSYLIESDTTVENLAQHIANRLKQEHPNDSFRVEAYEGVDKGAIGIT
ncbi:MAG: 6-carboxytetrahydropterin synthase [Sedimenticola sp.]|nr:6-carboxytetrahydropterin synthase [Sedimenticola sp.]